MIMSIVLFTVVDKTEAVLKMYDLWIGYNFFETVFRVFIAHGKDLTKVITI